MQYWRPLYLPRSGVREASALEILSGSQQEDRRKDMKRRLRLKIFHPPPPRSLSCLRITSTTPHCSLGYFGLAARSSDIPSVVGLGGGTGNWSSLSYEVVSISRRAASLTCRQRHSFLVSLLCSLSSTNASEVH